VSSRAIYSTLLRATAGTNLSDLYTPPAGFLWVVRDICMFINSPTVADQVLGVGDITTSTTLFIGLQSEPEQFFHWEGHQVVPFGHTLQNYSSGPSDVNIRVSGYQLTLP